MPIFTRHHYDACIFFVGTALYFRYRLLCYLVFNAVTLFIVSVYCFASSAASFSSSLSKRRNAVMAEPILPAAFMRGAKVKIFRLRRASCPKRLPHFKSLYSLAAARIYTLQALIHESAVLFFRGTTSARVPMATRSENSSSSSSSPSPSTAQIVLNATPTPAQSRNGILQSVL